MSNIVYSEAEYSIALTKANDFATFLDESIKEYINILDFLMEKAIEDDAIKAKILKLKGNISLYPDQIREIQDEMQHCLKTFADHIEEADAIVLPEKDIVTLQTILQAIMGI